MLRRRQDSKAQSISEYVVLIGIVTAALLGMQAYMKRGIQGVIKVQADQLGPQQGATVLINFKKQTSSVNLTNTSKLGQTKTQVSAGGAEARDTNITTSSTGSATYLSIQE